MRKLFTQKEFKKAQQKDKLPLKCSVCKKTFFLTKKRIKDALNPNTPDKAKICSLNCNGKAQMLKSSLKVTCKQCKKKFRKYQIQINKTKNNFCSKSCAATYNNTHKKFGTRRSKLEVWLETQLISLYPNLKFYFNKSNAVGSELDIYIPSLKLAFELNGIFHYEPVFGETKLNQIQNNDQRKFQACIKKEISLCIIDVSQQKYFKEQSSQKYLDIISNIIQQNLSHSATSP